VEGRRQVELEVVEDGRAFDVAYAGRATGIANMQDRLDEARA